MRRSSGPAEPMLARKRELRARLRGRRRALDAAMRRRLDAAINRNVIELARESGAGTVAGFQAFDGEPDVAPALAKLAEKGWRIALPVLFERPRGTRLQFRVWDPTESLHPNRFGIPEPVSGDDLPAEAIDLLLMPLVGWDEQGGRLGMGAGYYDRALASVANAARPLRAGIAYSVQRVAELPIDAHDVLLHVVITEAGRFTCRP